jgi:hypothetical protein
LQAKTAVDDAERYGEAADPNVQVGKEAAAAVSAEIEVVQDAGERLEEEHSKENKADDRMVVVELSTCQPKPQETA